MRIYVLLVFAAVLLPAQSSEPMRHAAHDALFEAFLPVQELAQEPKVQGMFLSARDGLWEGAKDVPAFQQLLAPFVDLRVLGRACHIPSDVTRFADLKPAERQHILFLLQSCSANEPRRLAMNVRNFYIVKAYGAVQEPLTGVKLNLHATPEYIARHMPVLPATRLVYDRERKQLLSKDARVRLSGGGQRAGRFGAGA